MKLVFVKWLFFSGFFFLWACRQNVTENQDLTAEDKTESPESFNEHVNNDKNQVKPAEEIPSSEEKMNSVKQKPEPVNPDHHMKDTNQKAKESTDKPALPPEKTVSLPDQVLDKNPRDKTENNPPVPSTTSDIRLYNELLAEFVSASGWVNYTGLKNNAEKLEEFVNSLTNDPVVDNGTEKEKLAFWINVYNANTLWLVTKNYPLKSIRDLNGGKPWDVVWIRIGKKSYSLNQIENEIIRPRFKEARIHFVLNCAAKSCPPLINKALTASNLESVLSTATRNFINGPENDIQESKANISSIFDWYREDFGDVITFLNQYSVKKIKAGAAITYKKYDWALNGK